MKRQDKRSREEEGVRKGMNGAKKLNTRKKEM